MTMGSTMRKLGAGLALAVVLVVLAPGRHAGALPASDRETTTVLVTPALPLGVVDLQVRLVCGTPSACALERRLGRTLAALLGWTDGE
ncbi:hypothetical protein QMK61_09060 [Fulvimonas sp. R45]|nr:hypothetical protein [Fulvimonas sp. R45]